MAVTNGIPDYRKAGWEAHIPLTSNGRSLETDVSFLLLFLNAP